MPVGHFIASHNSVPATHAIAQGLAGFVATRRAAANSDEDGGEARRCHFDIHRVERVSLTSIFFSGDDWRWTFRSASGATLAESGSYRSEAACRTAVAALQDGAASATLQRS